jgi:DNA-binding NarL/FixJ family response regulator
MAEIADLAACLGPEDGARGRLSTREKEVLRLVVLGLTNTQVADRLYLSPRTVEAHLRTVYRKLDVAGRTEAIRAAHERNLL